MLPLTDGGARATRQERVKIVRPERARHVAFHVLFVVVEDVTERRHVIWWQFPRCAEEYSNGAKQVSADDATYI